MYDKGVGGCGVQLKTADKTLKFPKFSQKVTNI